ncbi:MAG: hypothetical protein WCZ25_11995, partial [Aminobacteriaceae bacterium]
KFLPVLLRNLCKKSAAKCLSTLKNSAIEIVVSYSRPYVEMRIDEPPKNSCEHIHLRKNKKPAKQK